MIEYFILYFILTCFTFVNWRLSIHVKGQTKYWIIHSERPAPRPSVVVILPRVHDMKCSYFNPPHHLHHLPRAKWWQKRRLQDKSEAQRHMLTQPAGISLLPRPHPSDISPANTGRRWHSIPTWWEMEQSSQCFCPQQEHGWSTGHSHDFQRGQHMESDQQSQRHRFWKGHCHENEVWEEKHLDSHGK